MPSWRRCSSAFKFMSKTLLPLGHFGIWFVDWFVFYFSTRLRLWLPLGQAEPEPNRWIFRCSLQRSYGPDCAEKVRQDIEDSNADLWLIIMTTKNYKNINVTKVTNKPQVFLQLIFLTWLTLVEAGSHVSGRSSQENPHNNCTCHQCATICWGEEPKAGEDWRRGQ